MNKLSTTLSDSLSLPHLGLTLQKLCNVKGELFILILLHSRNLA